MKYFNLEPIGEGGQGSVQRGVDELGRRVAIKYVRLQGATNEQDHFRLRFKQEVEVLRALDHPGIVPVLDADVDAPIPYFVMPFAEKTLRDVLNEGPVEAELAERFFDEILVAVSFAHVSGVVHRDIKPENVLLLNGHMVLSDFGLGRDLYSDATTLTASRIGGGSRDYCAPEQLRDLHAADERADVYALGQVLYEILTSLPAVDSYDPALIPANFRPLIERAREFDKSERFKNATVMHQEFKDARSRSEVAGAEESDVVALIGLVSNGDEHAPQALLKLLIGNPLREDLHRPLIQADQRVLETLASYSSLKFHDVIARVLELTPDSEGQLPKPTSYFLSNVFLVASSARLRSTALSKLVVMNSVYGGWYVSDRLVETLNRAALDRNQIQIAERVWRSEPDAIRGLREDFYGRLQPAIGSRLRDVARHQIAKQSGIDPPTMSL